MSLVDGSRESLTAALGVLDICVCYSIMPPESVRCLVDTLCLLVNQAPISKDAWLVMRHLLLGAQALAAFNHLILLLTRDLRSDVGGSRASHQASDSHTHLGLTRGAVYLLSMAAWGSARVDSLLVVYSRLQVLEALLGALERCPQPVIAHELVLSLERLLKSFGHALRYEWHVILKTLRIIALTFRDLCHAQSHAPAAPQMSAILAGEAQVALGGSLVEAGRGCIEMQDLSRLLTTLKDLAVSGGDAVTLAPEDVLRIVALVAEYMPISLAEEALECSAAELHPAYGADWVYSLREFMHTYFRQGHAVLVRVRALTVLEKVLDNWLIMYQGDLIDHGVLPFLCELPRGNWPEALWRRSLLLLGSLARRLQCERFQVCVCVSVCLCVCVFASLRKCLNNLSHAAASGRYSRDGRTCTRGGAGTGCRRGSRRAASDHNCLPHDKPLQRCVACLGCTCGRARGRQRGGTARRSQACDECDMHQMVPPSAVFGWTRRASHMPRGAGAACVVGGDSFAQCRTKRVQADGGRWGGR